MHASEKDAGLDDEALKPRWYESGTYIIKPNTVYFKFWLVSKSILYLVDLYDVWQPFDEYCLHMFQNELF